MAYPNRIATSGQLGLTNDLLEYFRAAFNAFMVDVNDNAEGYDYDEWINFRAVLLSKHYPFNRQYYYSTIATIFPQISGNNIYTYDQPGTGWTQRMVNDWAKLKSIELAIFGSTSGSTSANTLSKFGTSLFPNVAQWTTGSLSLLRHALTRFPTYGACISPITQQPAPTNPVTNVGARTFNWTNATGKTNLADYGYRINNVEQGTPSSKPITIPSGTNIEIGNLEVFVKATAYYSESDSITNNARYPGDQNIYLDIQYFPGTGQINYTVSPGNGIYKPIVPGWTVSGLIEVFRTIEPNPEYAEPVLTIPSSAIFPYSNTLYIDAITNSLGTNSLGFSSSIGYPVIETLT